MTTDPVRSAVMRAVKSKNTTPEMIVRRLIHGLGFRYRLHRKNLPGNPDIALPGRRKVVFVHGCFWHGHDCNRGARIPKTNTDYWRAKITLNAERDERNNLALRKIGWEVLVVWECETKFSERSALAARLKNFLSTKPEMSSENHGSPF